MYPIHLPRFQGGNIYIYLGFILFNLYIYLGFIIYPIHLPRSIFMPKLQSYFTIIINFLQKIYSHNG